MSGPYPIAPGAASGRPLTTMVAARVLDVSVQGALIATGRARWLLVPPPHGPVLERGETLRLTLRAAPARGVTQAHLLAVGDRALEQQLPVELRAVARPASGARNAPPADALAKMSRPVDGATGPAATRAGLDTPAGQAEWPRPDRLLAGRLLQLLDMVEPAVSGREPKGWGTDPTIARPLADSARHGQEALPGGWRLHLLPFGGAPAMQELKLYLRDLPQREEREARAPHNDDKPRRAIFEVEFSRLGRCQVDVLCRARRFDVVLRSAAPLGPDVRSEVVTIFEAACEIGGLAGGMTFCAGELLELPVPPPAGRQGITV